MAKTSYAIGLGSNRYRAGPPSRTIRKAVTALESAGVHLDLMSKIWITSPQGPARRRFANATAIVRTDRSPPALLELCKTIERQFGRRQGRRWSDRIIDIDLLLWSHGCWASNELSIPHPALATREFALAPLAEIASSWRHPLNGRTIRQLYHRVRRNMPVDRRPNRP